MHIIAGYLRSKFRAGQAAFARGEHLLRAIVTREVERRQRQLNGDLCARVGAFPDCRYAQGHRRDGLHQPAGAIFQAIGGVNEKIEGFL